MCGTMVGSLWLNWITSGRFSAPVSASVARTRLRGRYGIDAPHPGVECGVVAEAAVDHAQVADRHATAACGQFVQDQRAG
jgi:hypothetical protein